MNPKNSQENYFERVESGYYQDKPVTERVRDLLAEHSPFEPHEADQVVIVLNRALEQGKARGIDSEGMLTGLLDQIQLGDDIPSKLEEAMSNLEVN
jgi:hypothetical protein